MLVLGPRNHQSVTIRTVTLQRRRSTRSGSSFTFTFGVGLKVDIIRSVNQINRMKCFSQRLNYSEIVVSTAFTAGVALYHGRTIQRSTGRYAGTSVSS